MLPGLIYDFRILVMAPFFVLRPVGQRGDYHAVDFYERGTVRETQVVGATVLES